MYRIHQPTPLTQMASPAIVARSCFHPYPSPPQVMPKASAKIDPIIKANPIRMTMSGPQCTVRFVRDSLIPMPSARDHLPIVARSGVLVECMPVVTPVSGHPVRYRSHAQAPMNSVDHSRILSCRMPVIYSAFVASYYTYVRR